MDEIIKSLQLAINTINEQDIRNNMSWNEVEKNVKSALRGLKSKLVIESELSKDDISKLILILNRIKYISEVVTDDEKVIKMLEFIRLSGFTLVRN